MSDASHYEIDIDHFAKNNARVPLVAENVTDLQHDVALGKNPRRELMEQRLNQVMIRSVNDGDIDLGAPQRLRRRESSESAPDDHNTMPAASGRSVHCPTSLFEQAAC
jgi:hypothetical protein